jgi:hypothetical protein
MIKSIPAMKSPIEKPKPGAAMTPITIAYFTKRRVGEKYGLIRI